MESPFTPDMFERMDDSEDTLFYEFPRKVVHIDEPAIAAAGKFMAEMFPPHGVLFDLMSSWRSHLPSGFVKQRMIGLGLNAEEMVVPPRSERGRTVATLVAANALKVDSALMAPLPGKVAFRRARSVPKIAKEPVPARDVNVNGFLIPW